MKYIIILAALLLSACEQKPEPAPVSSTETPNGYNLVTLFEADGCTMHRFYDREQYRYWATCGNQTEVTSEYTKSCGKGCTKRITDVAITTPEAQK